MREKDNQEVKLMREVRKKFGHLDGQQIREFGVQLQNNEVNKVISST